MNFTKTNTDDFSILKNGIDSKLEIIRHDETGYYNITKTANMINKLRAENNGLGGNLPNQDIRSKRVKDWLKNASTQELIEECKIFTDLGDVVYELNAGTRNEFRGTYVHRYLYDQFLNWLDVKYAIRISRLLDDIHQEANKKIIKEKDDKIDELSRQIKLFHEEAAKQRAEILGEVKEARADISDLHETVIEHHEAAMNAVQHASVDVAPSKRQYFALTSYQRVGDTSGKLYFTAWRRQASKMIPLLVAAMSSGSKDKNNIRYTEHRLVIPPIYFPGAVNLGNAGKSNLDKFVKNKCSELNAKIKNRTERVKISEFKEMIGLISSSVHPVWSPNNHLTHCEFVDCFLDEIKKAKVIKLSVAEPKLQEKIDTQLRIQHQSLINATGEAREQLVNTVELIKRAEKEMITPPNSDDDLSDFEYSDSE